MADHVSEQDDPLARFVEQLSNESPFYVRETAEETMKLRREFEVRWTTLMMCTDPREARECADWIAKHVHTIAERWTHLIYAARRWQELQLPIVRRWTGR